MTDHSKFLKTTVWKGGPTSLSIMVELTGLEPVTFCLQSRCSPN